MDLSMVLLLAILFCSVMSLRESMIRSFKIDFYEKKLRNRNVDISSVENIGLIGIWRE